MLEKYDELTEREKEAFSDVCCELLEKTYINREILNSDDIMVSNKNYSFARKNFSLLEEYFSLSG
jgi:predicted CopG family antitoxin